MDIQQQLEHAIGDGPTLPAAADRLAAGKAALRRRRLAVGVSAMVVAAAVVVPAAMLGGGAADQGTELTPVAPPSVTPTVPEPAPDQRRHREPRFPEPADGLAHVDFRTGELVIDPDAVVLRRIDDLYPHKDTRSVALDLRLGQKHEWYVLEWDDGGGAIDVTGADDGDYPSFQAFVAEVVGLGGLSHGPPVGPDDGDAPIPGKVQGLTMTPEGFEASGGTRIIEQRLDPDLPDNFATDEMRTAAAYVQMAGVRQLVLFRDEIGGGTGQFIAVHSAGHGDSLDALLDWARGRYEAEVGLL